MALTKQDVELLTYPFPAKAHKFNNDMPYIHEEIVNDRLDMVDPSWTWDIKHIERRANAGEHGKDVGTVWAHVTLTVKGVSRDAIGMAVIQQTNPIAVKKWNDKTNKNEPTGDFYTSEANEAEKSATTDALKRAARMFGIGRYLLAIPKQNSKSTVTTIAQMEKWLKDTFGEIKATPIYYEDENPTLSPLEPDFHGIGAWSETDMTAFWNNWNKGNGIEKDVILRALGIAKLSEWKQSLADADSRMMQYIK